MSTYLVLIYGDEHVWDAESAEETDLKGEGHAAFSARAGARVLAGGELQRSSAAVSLRSSPHERPVVTDGPFLESKEVIGGYYVIEAADRDEAIALARSLPELSTGHGGVEIRPLVERG